MVVAFDLLEMEPIHGVDFIQGDFREDEILRKLEEKLNGRRVGLVMSDMAPNMSGVPLVDQARVMHLAELGPGVFQSPLETGWRFSGQSFSGVGLRDLSALHAGDLQDGWGAQTGRFARSQRRALFARSYIALKTFV
jgi:23S rRNA U2552 (ribose-2'-O)-methylase RlmE/FtsJ